MAPWPLYGLHLSCLRFTTLPWAPVPPAPLAADGQVQSRVCHGSPCTASRMTADVHRQTLPCATFRSPYHCWWVPFW
ncbi:unnamed protein product [Staurois parvus]|uniref:Secreted protein n=1 Tax=Staurois parvus TaxID=386267 RepID=A0ABN9FYI1_9NEOB|nr:unnamed protein product [Staurois parvus]